MGCISCREALLSRILLATYIALALVPGLFAYQVLDSDVELQESSGRELIGVQNGVTGVLAPENNRVARAMTSGGEPVFNETVLTESIISYLREESLLLMTHALFFAISFIVAFIVARPLEKGYIVFDVMVKGGRFKALAERITVSLAVIVLVLSLASLPLGLAIYAAGAFSSVGEALLFSLSWLVGLSIIVVSVASAASIVFKSVAGVLLASFLAVWISLVYSVDKPLGSPLETYGLVYDFYGNYDPGLYVAIVAVSLVACYVATLRLEV